jgi:uncharacterized membrane protein (UPF0127 family)
MSFRRSGITQGMKPLALAMGPLVLGVLCALALVVGCGATGSASFQWHEVAIAERNACLPVAVTLAAQERGLQGVKHVVHPMVFAYSSPATPSFWMNDAPAALTGVWVGRSGRVIGYWRGQPESTLLHPAPAPVRAVIEYPDGARMPPVGSRVRIGAPCETKDRRL